MTATWGASPGWRHERSVLDADTLEALRQSVDEVAAWAEGDGPGLHHREQTAAGPVLARSERLIEHHAALAAFIVTGPPALLVAEILGEPAALFKEKINYKYPGGGGFAPHQDATAYRFVDHHVSVMVPIDDASVASGCLHVAPGFERGGLPTDDRGRIATTTADALDWRPVEVQPGDLLAFDSYTPHYSETNRTDRPRRALYLTYNAASQGDFRATYYADKEAEFAREGNSFGGERVRISISDDFLGRPVESP